MEYKKIEQLVYNNNLINRKDFNSRYAYNLEMDKLIIENLIRCINNNIKLEIDEVEFAKIYKIDESVEYGIHIDKILSELENDKK